MGKQIPASELIINKDGSIYHLSLKPEHLASTVIAVGDPDRVAKVSKYFDQIDFKISNREFITHTGTYKGKRISVISTGMGTDNIEIFLTELDALINIDLATRTVKEKHTSLEIIRIGTSGSMRSEIPAGSLLASEYGIGLDTLMCYYSNHYTPIEIEVGKAVQNMLGLPFTPYCVKGSEKLLKKLGKDLVIGNTATCPGFFGPQGREVRLKPAIPDIIEKLASINIQGFQMTNFEMETAGYYALGRLLGHETISLNAIVANRITQEHAKNGEEIVDQLILHTLNKLAE
jgi:uridine phosphorylase